MENFRITIGRQYGSGGKEVGRILAQKLGIPFYGKEELMKIAKDQPDYEEVRAFYEEQPVNSLLYAIAMEQGENRTGKVPFRKIRELCGSKSCILIGRCGSYIFREDPSCVKIFIYADMEKKIQWIENQENVSARKAKKLIEKVEEEREELSLTDTSFSNTLDALSRFTYEQSRENGYSSFSSFELLQIVAKDLTDADLPPEICFAYLDGDYYDSIVDSFRLCQNKLTPGAVVVVDDYTNPQLPGVAIAVDEWRQCNSVKISRFETRDSLAVIQLVV